jgi:hypothetical protein
VQTFLPYPDFAASASVLDRLRLGKQRVEALQIIRALTRPTYGWKHHPAVLMWQGHEEALGAYGLAMCREWTARGGADTCADSILAGLDDAGVRVPRTQGQLRRLRRGLPAWLGDEEFHRSHRSNLLGKDPEWYAAHFPHDIAGLDYIWPVRRATSRSRTS